MSFLGAERSSEYSTFIVAGFSRFHFVLINN
jgi:hypothetical protein